MFRRLYKFYRNFHYPINGALLGLVFGLLLAFAGLFKTIIICICAFIGYYLGRKLMQDKDFLRKLFDKFLPHN